MKFEYAAGSTTLNPDESEGLIPLHISTQKELNEWEQANIEEAEDWLFSKSDHGNFLTVGFLKTAHKKMFNKTWKWAGNFRDTMKSIGIISEKISIDLHNLLADVSYQIEHASYSTEEIAYRFHHRLVWIHPFANGNGRHARIMTDFLLVQAGEPRFTWGKVSLVSNSKTREAYIAALRRADKHDYAALAAFVRS